MEKINKILKDNLHISGNYEWELGKGAVIFDGRYIFSYFDLNRLLMRCCDLDPRKQLEVSKFIIENIINQKKQP